MDNILELHADLKQRTYHHGPYYAFNISDPKPRNIHKATVRDRLLHHAIYRILYPYFDSRFISDSYSCRRRKGTHKALDRFRYFGRKVSRNNTKTCWVLKCDIRKFFASVDHDILFSILKRHIADRDILCLLEQIISSFHSDRPATQSLDIECQEIGLLLGNLTSQLLVNIYMNEFDQFVKHVLKATYYIRYADDFVFMSHDKEQLRKTVRYIVRFLNDSLRLSLHPDKVSLRTLASGIDFLGWVHFLDHRVLRTTTKRRMLKRTRGLEKTDPAVQSYLGLLKHGNTRKLQKTLKTEI